MIDVYFTGVREPRSVICRVPTPGVDRARAVRCRGTHALGLQDFGAGVAAIAVGICPGVEEIAVVTGVCARIVIDGQLRKQRDKRERVACRT